MIYLYDGSLYGFLTAIFDGYPFLDTLDIKKEDGTLSFFEDLRRIATDKDKAMRVKKSLISTFSHALYREIEMVFQSFEKDKDRVLARVIRNLYRHGISYLNSLDPFALAFKRYLKNVRGEVHNYKGFIRLREIQNGYLFGELEPINDVLPLLVSHFKARLPREKWILYDRKRGYCVRHIDGDIGFFELNDLHEVESDREVFYREAWIEFYDAVSIDARRNTKCMTNHMPKRYWRYLPERR